MEVNTSLSLATDSPLDKSIKNRAVTELLNMVRVQAYDRRKLGEKMEQDKTRRLQGMDKSSARSHKENVKRRDVCAGRLSALQDLNEEDAQMLQECDEELSLCGDYRRIFPQNNEATAKWMNLFEVKRYCNVLHFEWITRGNDLTVQEFLAKQSAQSVKPKLGMRRTGSESSVLESSPVRVNAALNVKRRSDAGRIFRLSTDSQKYESEQSVGQLGPLHLSFSSRPASPSVAAHSRTSDWVHHEAILGPDNGRTELKAFFDSVTSGWKPGLSKSQGRDNLSPTAYKIPTKPNQQVISIWRSSTSDLKEKVLPPLRPMAASMWASSQKIRISSPGSGSRSRTNEGRDPTLSGTDDVCHSPSPVYLSMQTEQQVNATRSAVRKLMLAAA